MGLIWLSFLSFLLLFLAVGVASTFFGNKTVEDYLLANRNTKPWLVALSAVATNNSGYAFTGMIGYTYFVGFSAIWVMIGAVIGDFTASLVAHKKIRQFSGKMNILSFAGVISLLPTNGEKAYTTLRRISGCIIIFFLTIYASAQFSAGNKALYVLLNFKWKATGIFISFAIVLTYCLAGGMRASIWTDAAQAIVMIVSMCYLLIASINHLGGVTELHESLKNVSSDYLSLFPDKLKTIFAGPAMLVLGWAVFGFGVIGQPHIMGRIMTLDDSKNIWSVRLYYYTWYIAFYLVTISAAMCARIIIPDLIGVKSELALPLLSGKILPPLFIGFFLAGVFASTVSTADSQILSCTATLVNDFTAVKSKNYLITKLSTILFAVLALLLALIDNKGIFFWVTMSWGCLTTAFVPLLLVCLAGKRPSETTSILMLFSGLATTIIFLYQGGTVPLLLKAIPGFIASLLTYFIAEASTYLLRKK